MMSLKVNNFEGVVSPLRDVWNNFGARGKAALAVSAIFFGNGVSDLASSGASGTFRPEYFAAALTLDAGIFIGAGYYAVKRYQANRQSALDNRGDL